MIACLEDRLGANRRMCICLGNFDMVFKAQLRDVCCFSSANLCNSTPPTVQDYRVNVIGVVLLSALNEDSAALLSSAQAVFFAHNH